jgi:hypothetical protein
MHAAVEHFDQEVERAAPDAGETFGQHVGAQRHGGAHRAHGERLADTRRVTPQEIQLQRTERVPWNGRFGQRAKSGIDSVDRLVAGRLAIDHGTGRIDPRTNARRERDWFVMVSDREQVGERKRIAVKKDHEY